jgi:hypothetical protein
LQPYTVAVSVDRNTWALEVVGAGRRRRRRERSRRRAGRERREGAGTDMSGKGECGAG